MEVEREKKYQDMIAQYQEKLRDYAEAIEEKEDMIHGQAEAIEELKKQLREKETEMEADQRQLAWINTDREKLSRELKQSSQNCERRIASEREHIIRSESRKRRVMGAAWWAVLLFQMIRNQAILEDAAAIAKRIRQAVGFLAAMEKQLFLLLEQKGNTVSGAEAILCQWIATILATAVIVSVTGILVIKVVRRICSFYSEHFRDEITRMEWYISLAFIVVYAENLKKAAGINVFVILVGIHGVYLIARLVGEGIRGRRKASGW